MPGYKLDRFVDLPADLVDNLKCGICMNIYNKAVDTQCRHTCCYDCLKDQIVFNAIVCPICKQCLDANWRIKDNGNTGVMIDIFNASLLGNQVLVERNLKINSIVDNLKIKCDNEPNGCPEVMALQSLVTHLNVCKHKVCPTCGIPNAPDGHNCLDLLKNDRQELSKKLSEIEMNYEKSKSENKSLKSNVTELANNLQESEQLGNKWRQTCNEMSAKVIATDELFNQLFPMTLAIKSVQFGHQKVAAQSIELNTYGIKITDFDHKSDIEMSFAKINGLSLCTDTSLPLVCIELNDFNNFKICRIVPAKQIVVILEDPIGDILALLLYNVCKRVNNQCDCRSISKTDAKVFIKIK